MTAEATYTSQLSEAARQPRLSASLNRTAVAAAALIVFTSSFDIALVVQVGATFRFCQIFALIPISLAVLRTNFGAVTPILGARPLAIWLAFQIMFIPVGEFWPKSLGYCLWLLFSLALIFAFAQLFGDSFERLQSILRCYAYSFGALAVFGIVQFALPLLGYASPFVTQWWIKDRLPRVNGLSYEPSYFATYLLIGFVFLRSLRHYNSRLIRPRVLVSLYYLAGTAIVLSSSRMGIVFLLIDVLLDAFAHWFRFVKDAARLHFARQNIRAVIRSVPLISLVGVLVIVGESTIERNPAIALMLLNGTGVSNTAAHSVVQRETSFSDTLTVFLEHPFIGRSLGGISPAIAALHGRSVHSFEDSKEFEGMNVFAEALAASGVIGIVPFIFFLIAVIRRPLRLARVAAPECAVLLTALVRSLIFAWAILQFNQNMLRPYLWVHTALLAAVYAYSLRALKTGAGVANSIAWAG